jgi:MtN3 and saliva related transmembrane protein
MEDALGWTSSLVLLATILTQIKKQWTERNGEGVSTWLFIGQTASSIGFTVYSAMVGNWVFTITNALLLVSNLLGWGITSHFKRQTGGRSSSAPAASRATVDGR